MLSAEFAKMLSFIRIQYLLLVHLIGVQGSNNYTLCVTCNKFLGVYVDGIPLDGGPNGDNWNLISTITLPHGRSESNRSNFPYAFYM